MSLAREVQEIEGRFTKLSDADSMEAMTIRVVAQRDSRGEWCAVFGSGLTYEATDGEIFDSGFKLPRETAQILFPNISGKYRG